MNTPQYDAGLAMCRLGLKLCSSPTLDPNRVADWIEQLANRLREIAAPEKEKT